MTKPSWGALGLSGLPSAPAPIPPGRFAENAAGAQAVTWSSYNETTFLTSVEVSTSATGLTWSAPVTLSIGADAGPVPVVAVAPNGRVVVVWVGGPVTATTFPAVTVSGLTIVPGRAALLLSSGTVSTELVS